MMSELGRPTKYNLKIAKKILTTISAGANIEDACQHAGIHKDTFYEWKKVQPGFSDAVRRAEIDGKIRRLARIDKAGRAGHWQADAWYLERKFPDEYGRKLTLQISPEHAALLQLAGLTIGEAWKNLMEAIAEDIYADSNPGDESD
jgi:hypothetical protein